MTELLRANPTLQANSAPRFLHVLVPPFMLLSSVPFFLLGIILLFTFSVLVLVLIFAGCAAGDTAMAVVLQVVGEKHGRHAASPQLSR